MKTIDRFAAFILFSAISLTGCITTDSASQKANLIADQKMVQTITYANAAEKGPMLVVLPGSIKSANATFSQKVTPNNVADFAELELAKANFRVLERSDLGPMLDEISLAANLGDNETLKKFRRGRFESTQWFVKFDILKAEQVAQASSGFSAAPLLAIGGALLGGREGFAVDRAGDSIRTENSAGVWIVGLRYKILDAATTEQVSCGYFEDKMEIGAKASAVLGFSQSQSELTTLDSMVHRLVQQAVMQIDAQK
jgi:hypothetical protein